MKATKMILTLACAGFVLTGCLPDLIVSAFQITGAPTINGQGSVELPVRVTVSNVDDGQAPVFKTHVQYDSGSGTYVVAFTATGQTDIWYPWTSVSMNKGDTQTFNGVLTFHPSLHGTTVDITAHADSCSGDEFMPAYCRVQESSETNNDSNTIYGVYLP